MLIRADQVAPVSPGKEAMTAGWVGGWLGKAKLRKGAQLCVSPADILHASAVKRIAAIIRLSRI